MHKFRRPDSERISIKELRKKFYLKDGLLYSAKTGKRKIGCVKSTGYAWIAINVDKVRHDYSVHSIVFALKHGRWAKEVGHDDRRKLNNHADNLIEQTRKENQQDMAKAVVRSDGRKFQSMGDALEELGKPRLTTSNISRACKQGKTAYGYRWEYA